MQQPGQPQPDSSPILQTLDVLAPLIVYEDQDILLINKPQGMLTSSGPRDQRPTLWRMVQKRARDQKHRRQMGIIHRLDRDACGLLVFSKNNLAYQSLKKQFFKHTVQRVYLAITSGNVRPSKGTITSYLVESADGSVHKSNRPGVGERAISHYELCETVGGYSLVRVTLETGRKHQIRVHLASLGHPIVGDPMYQAPPLSPQQKKPRTVSPKNTTGQKLMLVAGKLCLDHPRTGKRLVFEIPLPDHMREFMRLLKNPADKT